MIHYLRRYLLFELYIIFEYYSRNIAFVTEKIFDLRLDKFAFIKLIPEKDMQIVISMFESLRRTTDTNYTKN